MSTTEITSEKPILFNTEMIQAILDGRKTQTRRVVKPQPGFNFPNLIAQGKGEDADYWKLSPFDKPIQCPYGQPADELWVRETFRVSEIYDNTKPSELPEHLAIAFKPGNQAQEDCGFGRWRPSIHMPRWASRIQLTVTDIRVERVQDIKPKDAIAEGVPSAVIADGHNDLHVAQFADIWDSINADRGYPFKDNNWVWVVAFEVKEVRR